MANEEVLRLRATVVSEEALANIRAIGREIGIVQAKGGRGAQQAATGWTQLGKTVRMVGGELAGAATGLTGIGAAGLGAAAGFGIVAAAGYKLVSGLGDLSKKIIDLNNNSKELGVSTQALKAFASEAAKAGIAPETMMQGMQNFKRNTEDFSLRIGQLRGQMVAMGAGPVLARINAATNQIDKLKEAYSFKEVLMEADPSGVRARRFFEMIGLGAEAARLSWEDLADTMARKKPISDADIEAAKNYQRSLIEMGEKWDALTTKAGIKLFPFVAKELDDITRFLGMLDKIDDWVEGWIGKGDPMGKAVGAINRAIGLDKFDPFGWKAEREKQQKEEDERRINATKPGSKQREKIEKEIRDRNEAQGVVAPQSVVRIPQMSAADREKLFKEEEARAAAAKEKEERDKAIAERAARGVSDRQSSFTGPGGVTVTQGGPTLEEDTARIRAAAEARRIGEEAERARKAAEEEERRRAASHRPAPPGMQSFPRMSPEELEKLMNGPAAGGDLNAEQFRNLGRQSGLNSNIKPVAYSDGFQPMGGGGDDSSASRIIKVGVFDALVDFKSYIEAGASGEGGGKSGFMRASLGGGGSYGGTSTSGGGSGPTGTLGDTSVGPYGGFGSNNSGGQSAPRPGPGGQGGGGTSGPSGVSGDHSGQNTPGSGGQQASRPGAGGQSGGPSGAKAPDGAPAGAQSGTIPGKFSEQITGMMAAGMQPKNIQAWLKEKGVDVSVATCGQFMAAKVKEAGGTPPTGAAVASNWNTFGGKEGAGYSDDPNAINIAVKQGVRTGQTGAHVTAAIPIKDKDGKITGWSGVGVNQGFGSGNAKVAGKGDYGRDVLTAVPLTIGTGKGQYQIRHQIVKPQGTEVATPNGQAPQGTQVASTDPNAGVAPSGSTIPRPGAGISGSTPEDEAIRATAASAGVTAPEWKAIADIESTRNAESNRGKRTQYKGLFQVNEEKVRRSGGKDIFNARDNANAAAQFSRENAAIFKKKMGREPTAAETYLMHQQGPGFYTKGTMTNIGGNLPPSLKGRNPSTITREEFEAGWSQEVNRRAAKFATGPGPAQAPANVAATAQPNAPTQRIDAQVAPPTPSGQVNVNVNSNGTKATAEAKTDGDLFQKPTVRQHRQMQRTEDAGEPISI